MSQPRRVSTLMVELIVRPFAGRTAGQIPKFGSSGKTRFVVRAWISPCLTSSRVLEGLDGSGPKSHPTTETFVVSPAARNGFGKRKPQLRNSSGEAV